MASTGHPDDVIDLHLAAGTHAEIAVDARVQVDAHGYMAVVKQRNPALLKGRKPAFCNAGRIRHVVEMRGSVMRRLRLVGRKQFDHESPGLFRTT